METQAEKPALCIPDYLTGLPHAPSKRNGWYFESKYVTRDGRTVPVAAKIRDLVEDRERPGAVKGLIVSPVNNALGPSTRRDGYHALLSERLEEGTRQYRAEKRAPVWERIQGTGGQRPAAGRAGDEPATERQIGYALHLSDRANDATLLGMQLRDEPITRRQASQIIDYLRAELEV